MSDDRLARLVALREAAAAISNPSTPFGQRARREVAATTGLSPEGIELALTESLEADVPRSTLSGLANRTPRVKRSHVVLSSNVFVGAFRAVALGLCQSPQVAVRASRREPTMARLLHEASGGAFELVEAIEPTGGDHVWAYGHDRTLQKIRRTLPAGVHFHAYGAGLGVAVFRESADMRKAELAFAVDGLARDVSVFDQRGCSSPRLVVVEGSRPFAETVCDLLVSALDRWEGKVPRGALTTQEQADIAWHESTMYYLGSCVRAGRGLVYLDPNPERIIVPPAARILHVTVTRDAVGRLAEFGAKITTVGLFNPGPLVGMLYERIGPRRYVDLGQMQKPTFDGPVDLRVNALSGLV